MNPACLIRLPFIEQKNFFYVYGRSILVIIFWNFTMFQHKADQPKVKRNLITSITTSVYELPHEYFQAIRVMMFLNLTMFKHRAKQPQPQVKRNLISIITNLVCQLPHDLPNELRLRILGNKISEKLQNQVETLASAQCPFQKLNFGNSS